MAKDLDSMEKRNKPTISHCEFSEDSKHMIVLPDDVTEEQYADFVKAIESLSLDAIVVSGDVDVNVISFK